MYSTILVDCLSMLLSRKLTSGHTVPIFCVVQGCQTVCFQAKKPNLGKFGMALDWLFIYLKAI
jgi:hypothetical protein